MQEVKDTSLGSVLGYHEIAAALVEADAHVEHYVRVSHLIDDLNFFNKVGNTLFLGALAPKSFHSDGSAHPLSLEHIAVASTTQIVSLIIKLKISSFDVEIESTLV